jgi:hypothetical protein
MAFYALVAQERKTGRWRTCAIFPSGSRHGAIAQAKVLRDSNALGFVPYPTNFKIRGASRKEMALLTAYLNSIDNTHIETFRQDHLESLLRIRQKLMISFFLGLFLQPEVMERRYGGAGGGKPVTIKNTTSGGVESEGLEGRKEALEDQGDSIEPDGEESKGGALTNSSEQEAALEALLSSDEANSTKHDNSEVDLDFL